MAQVAVAQPRHQSRSLMLQAKCRTFPLTLMSQANHKWTTALMPLRLKRLALQAAGNVPTVVVQLPPFHLPHATPATSNVSTALNAAKRNRSHTVKAPTRRFYLPCSAQPPVHRLCRWGIFNNPFNPVFVSEHTKISSPRTIAHRRFYVPSCG